MSKPAESYVKNLPPHVQAAKKSTSKSRVIQYVITMGGPEPTDNIQNELDREHYIEKQVKAVADPVLKTLGLEFDHVITYERSDPLFQ